MFKKLMILLPLALLSGEAMAGSGAGGQIRFFNDSSVPVSVTFSGVGCAGGYYGLTVVCDTEVVQPGKNTEYKYNWGVTTTWINVQAPYGDNTWKTWAPCSSSGSSSLCFLDHKTISTNAWVWSEYRYKGEGIPNDFIVNSNIINVNEKLLSVYKKYYMKAVNVDKSLPSEDSAFIFKGSRYISKIQNPEWFKRMPHGEINSDFKVDGEKSAAGKLNIKSTKLDLVSVGKNYLNNNTPIAQTLTTSPYSKQVTETTTTTTTNGFTSGVSFSSAVKGKADFIFAAAETTLTTTISLGYNFSEAVAQTLTKTNTYNIPTQNISVFPGCKALVEGSLKVGSISGDFTIKAPFIKDPVITQGIWLPPTYETSIWTSANMPKMMKLIKDSNQLPESELVSFDDKGNFYMQFVGNFSIDSAFEWEMSVTYEDIAPGTCHVINSYIVRNPSSSIIDAPTMSSQSVSQGINKMSYVYHVKPEIFQAKNINGAVGIVPWVNKLENVLQR